MITIQPQFYSADAPYVTRYLRFEMLDIQLSQVDAQTWLDEIIQSPNVNLFTWYRSRKRQTGGVTYVDAEITSSSSGFISCDAAMKNETTDFMIYRYRALKQLAGS